MPAKPNAAEPSTSEPSAAKPNAANRKAPKPNAEKTRDFSLRSDVDELLAQRWLRVGERVVNLRPVDGNGTAPGLDGIPVPRTTGQWVRRVLFWIGVALLVVLLIPILVYALEGLGSPGDPNEDTRRRRPLYARGDGRESVASRAVVPTLGRTGIWVLTDQRFAFVAVNGATTMLSKHRTGEGDRSAGPVEVETPAEVDAGQFVNEGRVERVHTTWLRRREQPLGAYYRVRFEDGSGIDLRNRHART